VFGVKYVKRAAENSSNLNYPGESSFLINDRYQHACLYVYVTPNPHV